MNHDVMIYTFVQQILDLINNSSLSMGELKFILESLLESITFHYENNIQKYLQSQNQESQSEEKIDTFQIPFEVQAPLSPRIEKVDIVNSGQE